MSNPATLQHQAQALAATLPALMVAARRLAATVAQGVHGRRRAGPGEVFWQYRRYQPGDAVRDVDWRQSARTDVLFLRESEWTAAAGVWIACDASPSMAWGSGPDLPQKQDRARLLALALAALLLQGGERVAILGSGRGPIGGQGALAGLTEQLLTPKTPANGAAALTSAGLPRYARVVWVGDFLDPLAEIETAIATLAGAGVRGHLLQVMDPAELSFPFHGRVHFEGLEGEAGHLVSRAEGVRGAYRRVLAAHCAALRDGARHRSWSLIRHTTDQPAEPALLALHQALGGPGRG